MLQHRIHYTAPIWRSEPLPKRVKVFSFTLLPVLGRIASIKSDLICMGHKYSLQALNPDGQSPELIWTDNLWYKYQ